MWGGLECQAEGLGFELLWVLGDTVCRDNLLVRTAQDKPGGTELETRKTH